MARTLAAVAREVNGTLHGADAAFGAVTTDTRTLGRGELFVAIRGERFDGNDYVPAAFERGAAGALVSRLSAVPLSQVAVPDTRSAFGALSRAWRRNFAVPVVAVTGSSGKTTVKELIAGILRVSRTICVTQGNLNNDIGVPLTLMRLDTEHEALVVELGANHAGEIDYLAGLAEPTVAVITNAAAAHLEGFGSIEGVAHAKGEILDHLRPGGTAVLNADDRFARDWQARAGGHHVVTFGLGANADCKLRGEPRFTASGAEFGMRLADGEELDVRLPLLGRQNVANALAAAAAARAAGATGAEIVTGLERAAAVRGRMRPVPGLRGAAVIDDSYNANPGSVRAALDYLALLPGTRILVLGDMKELGADEVRLHEEIGAHARGRCDRLVAVGTLAAHAAQAFGAGAHACADLDEARDAVAPDLGPDVTVLVKGSRAMGLERLVAALAAGGKPAQC